MSKPDLFARPPIDPVERCQADHEVGVVRLQMMNGKVFDGAGNLIQTFETGEAATGDVDRANAIAAKRTAEKN